MNFAASWNRFLVKRVKYIILGAENNIMESTLYLVGVDAVTKEYVDVPLQ